MLVYIHYDMIGLKLFIVYLLLIMIILLKVRLQR